MQIDADATKTHLFLSLNKTLKRCTVTLAQRKSGLLMACFVFAKQKNACPFFTSLILHSVLMLGPQGSLCLFISSLQKASQLAQTWLLLTDSAVAINSTSGLIMCLSTNEKPTEKNATCGGIRVGGEHVCVLLLNSRIHSHVSTPAAAHMMSCGNLQMSSSKVFTCHLCM